MRGKVFCYLMLGFVFFACQKKTDFSTVNIIGHAGMGLENMSNYYHDNSYEAIEMALAMEGCDGVEVDVQCAEDGTLWLYHDDELNSQTNTIGCIGDKVAMDLQDLKYNTLKNEKLLKINSLPWDRLTNKRLFLDIRHYNACHSTLLDPQKMIAAIQGVDQLFTSVKLAVILNRKQWAPFFVNAGFKVYLHIYPDKDEPSEILENFEGIEGVVFKNSECRKEDVEFWKSKGKKVVIFEMRSPKGIKNALNKKPDEVITDDIRATIIEKY